MEGIALRMAFYMHQAKSIRSMQSLLTEKDKETIRNESRFAFTWMQPDLERISSEKQNDE